VAASLAPEVDWRPGDAATIPFEDATFDASVSQFGLMFFTDRPGSIREMLRVVRPGGRVAVAVWDSIESSPVYPIEVELLERLAGPAAAEALRAPFVLGDTAVLTELARSAGVDAVEVRTVVGEARFPSVRSMVEADLRGWLPLMGVHLDESVVEQILAEAEIALDRFVTETGALVFDSPAHILSGSRC
jgi:SAM-dependent methyltransferase